MRARRFSAISVLVAVLVGSTVFAVNASAEEVAHHLVFTSVFLAYPVVAAVILWRRSHPVGWLLLGLAALLALSDGASLLLEQPEPPGTSTTWVVLLAAANLPFPLFAMLLPALGLRFPDGQRLSPRWRYLELAYGLGVVCVLTGMMLAPEIAGGPPDSDAGWGLANPLSNASTELVRRAAELVATATLFPAIIGSILAVILRFRRSTGIARLQMRVLTYALLAVILTWPVIAGSALLVLGNDAAAVVSGVYPMLLFAVPPVAMGVAISRHRLYDLDRLVSRTLSYALVTAVLAALYAGAVVGLGYLTRPLVGSGGDLVVALSTLLVAAAFQPVRRRVQSVVDRRFNRARYDAQRTSEAFAQRLRNEVDLVEVRRDLAATVRASLQPSDVRIWLPEEVAP